MSEFALRCFQCHHCLAHAMSPMQLVALFHSSVLVRVPESHPQERRHRCRSCGFVNIYHPLETLALTERQPKYSFKQRA